MKNALIILMIGCTGCASNLPDGQPSCGTTYLTRAMNPDYLASLDPGSCKSFASRYEDGTNRNTHVMVAPSGVPGT